MNKALILISILLGSILVIVNYISVQPLLFITRVNNWTVVIGSIIIWMVLWFSLKWLLNTEDNYENNDWINF